MVPPSKPETPLISDTIPITTTSKEVPSQSGGSSRAEKYAEKLKELQQGMEKMQLEETGMT